MNSIMLRSTSSFLRTGISRRTVSSVCVRPATASAVVDSVMTVKNDFRSSTIGNHSLEPRRFFSSNTTAAAADALVDLLNREHTEEIENKSTDIPESLKDLHHLLTEEQGWKIVTDDDTAVTKLYKTVDAIKVQMCFHCQDATEQMAEHDEDDDGDDDDAGAEEEQAATVRCTLSVTKGGKTLFMVCIAQDSVMRIQSTAMAGAVTDIDALHASGINPNLYQGPEFSELAEDLQDGFHTYVEDYLGINSDVAAYVIMHFDYKEQCQYVKFLEEAKAHLA